MDQPGLPERDHQRALAALVRINWVSQCTRRLWPPIRDLALELGRPLRVLDVATGAGDVPLRLWRRARLSRLNVEFAGCDISETALNYARRRAASVGAGIRFFQLDALRDEMPHGFDVLTSSLFLHHLDESAALEFLRKIGNAARHLALVHDLVRSRQGYWLAWLATRFLSTSWVARIDGPLSIRGAFNCAEVETIAASAGLMGAAVTRHWPQRFLLKWRRPQ
jgi:SAM-dependent methyltransferase